MSQISIQEKQIHKFNDQNNWPSILTSTSQMSSIRNEFIILNGKNEDFMVRIKSSSPLPRTGNRWIQFIKKYMNIITKHTGNIITKHNGKLNSIKMTYLRTEMASAILIVALESSRIF